MTNLSGQHGKPAPIWNITGERVRLKNMNITCPSCGGREYIIGLRGVIVIQGDKRRVKLDDSHRCPHCGAAGLIVEAE